MITASCVSHSMKGVSMAYVVLMCSCHCTQSSHWRNISSVIDEDVLSLLTLCVGSGAVWCK